MTVWIGTSGWQYASWRGGLYPEKLPQRLWLEHYAQRFGCVEVNNTFYRLPERGVFEDWAHRAPSGFRFALKLSRYLTHVKRLKDPEEPVQRFLEHSEPLRANTGPLLLQLPPNMPRDDARLADTLARFPAELRVAVEFREPSWFDDSVASLLAEHGAALVLSDRGGSMQEPSPWRTASWGYIRLHEGRGTPYPCYRPRALREWAERIAGLWPDGEVDVYFNNDPCCCAPRDAVRFAAACAAVGLRPTRVPAESDLHLTC